MQYIYSRVSTDNQTVDNQIHLLRAKYPHAAIVEETASGAKRRPKLEELLSILREGDELIVAALDRLGRKTSEVLQLIETLEDKGIILKSEREGVDYSTITGRLVTQILCSVAEMERNIISERTILGLAARRAQGVVLGRTRIYTDEQVKQVKYLRDMGKTLKQISVVTGISVSRVHQLCKLDCKG